jgi:hypothetical protein
MGKALAFDNTKPTDVLHLNVGGAKMAVSRQTLTSVPGSVNLQGVGTTGLQKIGMGIILSISQLSYSSRW